MMLDVPGTVEAIVDALDEAGQRVARALAAHEGARVDAQATRAASDRRRERVRSIDAPIFPLDHLAHEELASCLRALSIDAPIVSEEAPFPEEAEGARLFWLVDPIDGSHNARIGFPAFTFSVALIEDSAPIFAWVHDPARSVTYYAARRRGAYVRLRGAAPRRLRLPTSALDAGEAVVGVIGGRRAHDAMARLSKGVGKIRALSCSSLDLCLLAAGVLDAFVDVSEAGHERDCDVAAAMLIVTEAGGHVALRDGSPLRLHPPSTASIHRRRPLLAASSKTLLDQIATLLSPLGLSK